MSQHVSACSKGSDTLNSLKNLLKGSWGLFLVGVWSMARKKLVGFGLVKGSGKVLVQCRFPSLRAAVGHQMPELGNS